MIASRIKLQLEPLDYTVLTDMKWVDFILNQILVNAIKYRSASPSIHIYAQQEKNSVASQLRITASAFAQRICRAFLSAALPAKPGANFQRRPGWAFI